MGRKTWLFFLGISTIIISIISTEIVEWSEPLAFIYGAGFTIIILWCLWANKEINN